MKVLYLALGDAQETERTTRGDSVLSTPETAQQSQDNKSDGYLLTNSKNVARDKRRRQFQLASLIGRAEAAHSSKDAGRPPPRLFRNVARPTFVRACAKSPRSITYNNVCRSLRGRPRTKAGGWHRPKLVPAARTLGTAQSPAYAYGQFHHAWHAHNR
jgi:hypothetical protein